MDGSLDALLAKPVHALEQVGHGAGDDARIFWGPIHLNIFFTENKNRI